MSMNIKMGTLTFQPAKNNPQLLAKPVQNALKRLHNLASLGNISVAEINPEFSDSIGFCKKYNIPQNQGANCLIVEAKRGNEKKFAACLVPINSRANLNRIVRKHLNARQVSLAPKDFAVSATGMEYGSITIIGLPSDWQLLIDESLVHLPYLIIGGGLRISKLLIPGNVLKDLPNATVLPELTIPLS